VTSGVFIVAEAGVNHNGSLDLALQLVDKARDAGADAVKFQTFRANDLIAAGAPKAEYQKRQVGAEESQLDMVRRLELSASDHRRIAEHCADRGIEFMSTPFDSASLRLLVGELNVRRVKVASGEITNAPFLWEIGACARPIILSTGMSTLDEVARALGVLAAGALDTKGFRESFESKQGKAILRERVTLLHCTSEYPAPFEDVNLHAMQTLAREFGLPVGYSDHTEGINAAVAAVALGACVVEKHLTLDRNLPGPDHRASLEPSEFARMVEGIRQVERALGSELKEAAPGEIPVRDVARRSLVALRPIRKGEAFSTDNLGCKRPGTGASPFGYWDLLGKRAHRDYGADELIDT
jgi:N-acetylneuraminate synthase